MAASTWTWNGGSAAATTSNWILTSGAGNSSHHPQAGDTAIIPDGTVVTGLDPNFRGSTIEVGGTAGTVAVLITSGDQSSDYADPTADATTVIANAVPGHTTPEAAVLDAGGVFVNEGTILADGPAGSVFTINLTETTVGASTIPGYFFNPGTIEATTGNTLVIDVGPGSELFNSGSIVADGGTVVVDVAPGAIAGGDAPVRGFEVIEGGGTLETEASYPASDANNGTRAYYEFGDSTAGNTLKIDNVGSFGGAITGFAAGDTIDLGTLLPVGTLAYSTATGLLSLEAANGTTLASLILGNFGTGLAAGTFALVNGVADGIRIGVGGDGDTVLTTQGTLLEASGTSGTWQSGASWVGGVVPGTTASPTIGTGASAPFTLTTGSAPVSVGGFAISSSLATVKITSDMTLTTGQVSDYSGTLDIAAGDTLTGGAIQLLAPSASVIIAAGATADLAGRIDLNLGPSGGVRTLQPGGNPYAFIVSAGTAVIDGALLAGPSSTARGGSTSIGYDSPGQSAAVIVNAGGTVTDTHTTLGSTPTSSGTLTLDGAGASWTDEIDTADTYSSRGNITVGYDDLALNTPGSLAAPGPIAAAQLVVENHATLTEQAGATIGYTPDSAGNVTIETGGLWNIGSPGSSTGIGVGYGGSGSLSVLNGGTVAIYSGGTFLSSGTTITSGGIGIGNLAGASGTVTVSGAGSRLSTTGGMSVGKLGQGLLDILNGGTVTINGGGVSVGQTIGAGSSGTVIVGGTGSAAALDFTAAGSNLTLGGGSGDSGTVMVGDNGTINLNGTGYLTIGGAAGAFGDVVVGGTTASAVIDIGTDGLTVGNAGTAELTVNNLGTISMTGTRAIVLGQSAGAAGTITVEGTSASLSATGGIDVGWLGQATLTVRNDATVNTSSLALDGQPFGQLGNLADLVTIGTGGHLEATGALYVWQGSTVAVDSSSGIDVGTSGDYMSGAVDVESGHSIVGDGLIAAAVFNDGLIDVSSSHISTPGTMEITGRLTGTGTIYLAPGSILKLDGSLAATQSVQFGAGGAEALILNDTTPGTITNSISGLNAGDQIEFAGVTSITNAEVTAPGTITVQTNLGTYVFNNVTLAAGVNPQLQYYYYAGTGEWAINLVSEDVYWTGATSTDLGTATNWSPSGVPTPIDALNFYNDAGGTLTGTGSGEQAYFYSSTGTWTLQDATLTLAGTPEAPYQPFALAENGNLTVNGGALTGDGLIRIYSSQGATMVAQGGAQVSFQGLQLGDQAGTEGDLLVSGAGTTWRDVDSTIPTGYGGELYVGEAAATPGGPGGGVGHVTITAGASMIDSYQDIVGVGAGSDGDISVTDGGNLTDAGLTVGQSGFGMLTVNGGSVDDTGSASVGANAGGLGEASVSAGTFSVGSGLTVGGNGGSGVLDVNTGGTVLAGTGLTVGTATEVNGTIYGGNGSLNIGAGGVVKMTVAPTPSNTPVTVIVGGTSNSIVGPTTAATGDVSVAGAGALLDTDGNPMDIGQSSNGLVTVSQGGSLVAGTANANTTTALQLGRLADGQLIVTDPGSSVTANGGFYAGRAGTGSLTVENSATMTVNPDGSGINFLDIGGSGFTQNDSTQLLTGGSGSALVTTKGYLVDTGNINVGLAGDTGRLTVTGGGTAEAGDQLVIGTDLVVSALGTVTTTSGTTVLNNATTFSGDGVVDVGSGSLLKIDGNGITSAGTSDLVVGAGQGASGVLNVTGAGATVNTEGFQLAVGSSGQGTLLVSQGGTVLAGTPFASAAALIVGGSAGSTGAIAASDPGSNIDAVGQIVVGRSGAGSLTVENQATVVSGGSTLAPMQGFETGLTAGASGDAFVTGTQSLLSNTGRFIIGDAGLGSLSIQSGGTVITSPGTVAGLAGATIANTAAASGSSASVTGIGSNWHITGSLVVGNAGFGQLSLSQGATVAAGTLDMGAAATGDGVVSVVGTTTALTLTGDLTVGDQSTGELTILSGAHLNAANANIGGAGASSPSSVDIEGTGSEMNLTGSLAIGLNGPAVFTLGLNTTLVLSGNVLTGPNGTFNQSGTVDPPNIINDGVTNLQGGAVDIADISVENSGVYTVKNGTATIYTPLVTFDPDPTTDQGNTNGTWELNNGGTLVLNATTVDASQAILFNSLNAELVIGQQPDASNGTLTGTVSPGAANVLPGFQAPIENYKLGDKIVFAGLSYASDTLDGNTVTLWSGPGGTGDDLGSLSFLKSNGVSADTTGAGLAALQIAAETLCFLPGTLLATPSGQTEVERLAVGDLVRTVGGQDRPIVWIGVGRVLATRGRRNAATPVIVRKGALAPNVPHADLRVTKGHSLLLDGMLIPVEFLVNHRTILWDDRAQEVSVYHIELETHDVLLANGAAAESYRDDGNRWLFQNANSGWGLPPQVPYAPVVTGGAVVDAVWWRLLDRAGARPLVPLTDDPDLHLVVDGVRVDAVRVPEAAAGGVGDDVYVFALRGTPGDVRVVSRAAVPQELGVARDARCLGVAVRRVAVRQGTRFRVVRAGDRALGRGFYPLEAGARLRWTDGDAVLPADLCAGFKGSFELVLHVGGTTQYVEDDHSRRAVA